MKNLFALLSLGSFAPTSQTTHIIDEFTSVNNYYSAFNNGSGSLNTSINRGDFASGSSSFDIHYSFDAGANFFFSSLRNYGTTAQDYSYLTTGFSVMHKGGHADDQIAIRLWEDTNGNGAFDGEDEVYQSTTRLDNFYLRLSARWRGNYSQKPRIPHSSVLFGDQKSL